MGDTTKIAVVDCGEVFINGSPVQGRRCPFHHAHEGDNGIKEQCSLAGRIIYQDDPVRPEWCPLTKSAVLVQLRAR